MDESGPTSGWRADGGTVQSSQEFHASLPDGGWCGRQITGRMDRRGLTPIGLSIGPVEAHRKWEPDIAETQGVPLDFPMIADTDRRVSTLYDMMHPAAD